MSLLGLLKTYMLCSLPCRQNSAKNHKRASLLHHLFLFLNKVFLFFILFQLFLCYATYNKKGHRQKADVLLIKYNILYD